MINTVFRFSMLFAFLILLQVLVLNNIHMSIYLNPYIYILFIILLPFESPGWLNLSLAFFTGIILDAFSNTMGMHTSALVLLAFARKYLLNIMAPRDGYEQGQTPHYSEMGLFWFIIYAGILTLIHHFALFILEDFRSAHFFSAALKALLSSFFSLAIMVVLMLFSYRPK